MESAVELRERPMSQVQPEVLELEAPQTSLDALLQISRGDRMVGQAESLTAITASIVETMPPAERLRPVEKVVARRLGSVLDESQENLESLSRGQALLAMAVIADRIRYVTNTTDTFAARLIGMNYFAGRKPVEAARIVGGENANLETVRSNLSIVLGKVRKKGWEDLAPRLRSLIQDSGAKIADFMGLHDEIAATATKVAQRDRWLGKAAIASRQKSKGAELSEPFLEDEPTPMQMRLTLDTLGDYMNKVGEVKLLNKATEVGLAKRIEAGLMAKQILSSDIELTARAEHDIRVSGAFMDEIPVEERERLVAELRRNLQIVVREGEAARERFINANLRLVITMAQRKVHRNVPPIELIQYGNIGLVEAVNRFDYTKGYKFSTFATPWINKYIHLGIYEYSHSAKISQGMFDAVTKLNAVESRLMNEIGSDFTLDTLAKAMEFSEEKTKEVLKARKHEAIHLDAPVGEDMTLYDVVADLPENKSTDVTPEVALLQNMRERIQEALNTLSERNSQMMRLRFGFVDGEEHSLSEVAEAFGVTTQRIGQIETRVMGQLRKRFPDLQAFLD